MKRIHKKPKKLSFIITAKVDVDLTNQYDFSILDEFVDTVTQHGEILEIAQVHVESEEIDGND